MRNPFYMITVIILASIPLLVASTIIYIAHGSLITDYHLVFSDVPNMDSGMFPDEIYQWHQIDTFQSAGFNGGYYTVDENTAEFEFFRFFAWGPFPSIFYGTISKIIGYNFFTTIVVNTVLFMLGTLFIGSLLRLNNIQMGMLAVTFIVFPNLVLYLPSVQMEMLNIIVALVQPQEYVPRQIGIF